MPFRCKSRKALKMLNKRRNVRCKMQNSKWKNLCHTVEIRYPEALRAKPVRNKPLRGKDIPILGTGWIPHKNIAVRRIKKGCQRLTTSSIVRSSLCIFHFALCTSIFHYSLNFFPQGLFFARWEDPLKSRDTWWNSENAQWEIKKKRRWQFSNCQYNFSWRLLPVDRRSALGSRFQPLTLGEERLFLCVFGVSSDGISKGERCHTQTENCNEVCYGHPHHLPLCSYCFCERWGHNRPPSFEQTGNWKYYSTWNKKFL